MNRCNVKSGIAKCASVAKFCRCFKCPLLQLKLEMLLLDRLRAAEHADAADPAECRGLAN